MPTYQNKNNKSARPISHMIIGTIALIGVGACSLYGIERYNKPQLYGKWISTETHEEIAFNEDGTVTLNDVIYTPKFQLISPNKMLYTIEDKQFETYYHIDGRYLDWGMSETEVEQFKRK